MANNENKNVKKSKKAGIFGMLLGVTAVVAGVIAYGNAKKAEEETDFELEDGIEVEDSEVEVEDSEEE